MYDEDVDNESNVIAIPRIEDKKFLSLKFPATRSGWYNLTKIDIKALISIVTGINSKEA